MASNRKLHVTSTSENCASVRSLMPIFNHMVTANIITRAIANTRSTHVKKIFVTEQRIMF